MSIAKIFGASLFCAVGAYATQAAADEVVNIPLSAGLPSYGDPASYCYSDLAVAITAPTAGKYCEVAFPLTVPTGHAIKQIAVVHSDNQAFPNPFIQANLDVRQVTYPYKVVAQFWWNNAYLPVHPGEIDTTNLMAQSGNNYPDAFTVDSQVMYAVIVRLLNGSVLYGLEVTYD